jgi:endonuclease/exonuclease/phosphatase family metal-dependent hydrolase
MARQARKCRSGRAGPAAAAGSLEADVAATLRVLTWNLFHGRSLPPAGRSLHEDYAAAIAGWEWDVALLQEVPPWWPPALAERAGAQERTVLTSRNWLPALQRALAERLPDVMRSWGGGANAILSRRGIEEHRHTTLRRRPERRLAHAVRMADGGWAVNLHATARHRARAAGDLRRARAAALAWSNGAPLVLGGDLNLRDPQVPGLLHVARSGVDHVFCRGWEPVAAAEAPGRGGLSDHAPVAVGLRSATDSAGASV